MGYVITAVLAFVAGLVVMGIYKARAAAFLSAEIARLKGLLPA